MMILANISSLELGENLEKTNSLQKLTIKIMY